MTTTAAADFRSARRVLLLGAQRVGDMLFGTPAIKMLADYRPDLRMDAIVFSALARQVLAHNPAIDRVYVSPKRWQLKRIAREYDMAIAVHDSKHILQCAPCLHNARIYRRRGLRIHMSEHPAHFVRQLLDEPDLPIPTAYQLFPQGRHYETARALLEERGVNLKGNRLICCHMGCRRVAARGARLFKSRNIAGDTKSWEFANFAALAGRLAERHPDLKLVLTGTRGERRIAKKYLSRLPNIVDLIGRTSVLDLAALMKYCEKFLSGDTGPLHVACATDIPLVALFGKTDPAIYGPLPAAPHRIVLRKSDDVNDVTVHDVESALLNGCARL